MWAGNALLFCQALFLAWIIWLFYGLNFWFAKNQITK